MNILDISQFLIGTIVAFARIYSFLAFVPFLKSRSIPRLAKTSFAMALALFVAKDHLPIGEIMNAPVFIATIFVQIAIGVTLAYVVDAIFSATSMAGSLFDLDMGFSNAQIFNPGSNQASTIFSNLFLTVFGIIFIMLGGMNNLIIGITYSFQFEANSAFLIEANFIDMILAIFLFVLNASMQIALPLIASMFIVNIMILVLGKVAPQMGIFANMFIIKIAAGFLLFVVSIPMLGEVFVQLTNNLNEKFLEVLEVLLKV